MQEVYPERLWIGHALDIREPRPLFEVGITSIVDVAFEEKPAVLPRQLVYCRFPLNDGGGNDPKVLLQSLQTTIHLLESGMPTLVGCSAGMSRSPAVAAFALAYHLSKDPDQVIQRIANLKALELNRELWNELNAVFQTL